MYCRNCGEQMNDNQAICIKCGVKVGEGTTYCANCDEISSWSYHEGGVSTCQQKAVCDICHHEYGDFAPCSGGTATCTEQAVCATCGEKYGEILPHDHGTAWKNDANEHWNECACGDKVNIAPHADTNNDEKCDTCGYEMPATGTEPGTEPIDSTSAEKESNESTKADGEGESTESGEENNDGGCGSSFGAGAAIIAAVIGIAIFFVDKKRK